MKTLHLRFDCEASTSLHLGGWLAGSNLRGALGQVMQRAVCAETRRRAKPTPEHAAVCPSCWLLAAETEPGEVRRAYSLLAPFGASASEGYVAGQRFSFGLTLFGSGVQYLPYFVLAVPQMGRDGVGRGRGKFALHSISAHQPLSAERQTVLAPGENMVRSPSLFVTREPVWSAAQAMLARIKKGRVSVRFVTPTRLTTGANNLLKIPDFGALFARLIDRLQSLHEQYGGTWQEVDVRALRTRADRVRLLEADVEWIDFFSHSNRLGRATPMGGFVGTATYHSFNWDELLPWLVWGQAIQVGKHVVKGNGWFEISTPPDRRYGRWLSDALDVAAKVGVDARLRWPTVER